MKRLILSTSAVWLLILYPVWEMTRMILLWRQSFAPKGDWETAFEIGVIWTLYLVIPLALWLADKGTRKERRV